jgi:hypothetical protein
MTRQPLGQAVYPRSWMPYKRFAEYGSIKATAHNIAHNIMACAAKNGASCGIENAHQATTRESRLDHHD